MDGGRKYVFVSFWTFNFYIYLNLVLTNRSLGQFQKSKLALLRKCPEKAKNVTTYPDGNGTTISLLQNMDFILTLLRSTCFFVTPRLRYNFK